MGRGEVSRQCLDSPRPGKCQNGFLVITRAPKHPRSSYYHHLNPQEPSWALNEAGWATLLPRSNAGYERMSVSHSGTRRQTVQSFSCHPGKRILCSTVRAHPATSVDHGCHVALGTIASVVCSCREWHSPVGARMSCLG